MTSDFKIRFQQKTLLNFINEARSLYDRKHFTDVTLQCEGEIFPVHKLVLAANSPYFRDYFIQKPDLTLANMSIDFLTSEVLQIILNYFYTGTINIHKKDHVSLLESIIEASSVLQIPLLSDYCLELLLNKTINEMSLSDYKVIEKLNSKVLSVIFLQNIISKLATFNETEDFLQLSANEIKVLLQCPGVAASDQNVVFQSILNWIKYDSDGRKELLTELLESFVDFQRINPEILSKFRYDQLVFENIYFLKSYFKMVSLQIEKYSLDPKQKETQLQVTSENIVFSNFQTKLNSVEKDVFQDRSLKTFFIYDFKTELYDESHIYMYDYIDDELEEVIAHPLVNRKNATIFYYKGSIYSFGGESLNRRWAYQYICVYNIKTKQWLKKCWMSTHKHQCTVAELNGCIYIVGGIYKEKYLKSVDRYNPLTNSCISVADLPDTGDQIVPVVAVSDCLFALIKTKLYKYIPKEDKWTLGDIDLSKYLSNEEEVHMSKGKDEIYIIKKTSPKTVLIYDLKGNSLEEDIIPAVLTECDGILNLENPEYLEFLVSGGKKWFIYTPQLHSWITFEPKKLKDYEISMLTLVH